MALNNNQITNVLTSLYQQITGDTEVTSISLQGVIDTASDNSILTEKDTFTKALISRLVNNWFTDSSYRSSYTDLFFQNEAEFGAIVQAISIEAPAVQESHAWKEVTSGVTTAGSYVIYTPIIHAQYYGKSVSWELPVAVTYEQWDTAVASADGLNELIQYVFLAVDNALTQHLEDLDNANRNNFIAEKIAYATAHVGEGVHVVNLLKAYVDETGANIKTAKEFLSNADALRYASGKLGLYMDYMRKQSKLFNTAGYTRFTPTDRLVVQILSDFKTKMDAVALSTTFHDEYVALPNHQAVPYWQGALLEGSNPFDFKNVSSIDIVTSSDGTAIKKSGIVAFMCDKWAIVHTLIKHRVAVKDFNPEAITQYYYQFRDRYMNNLTLNAIVFTIEDISTPASTPASK